MTPQQTAILIFAQSAKRDSLTKGIMRGEQLFDQLTREAVEKAEASGLPFFHIGEQHQHGEHFGLRLANAIQCIFDKGYEKLIIIGNDSPDLQAASLTKAAGIVEEGIPVLGPSMDGGVYLLGLHQSDFQFEAFVKLPWNKGNLRSAMVTWLQELGANPYSLDPLMELDSEWDLKVWFNLNTRSGRRLLSLLSQAITRVSLAFSTEKLHLQEILFSIFRNKGSPDLLRFALVYLR